MALIKPQFDNLEDLFWDQVKDIYDAEQRLTDALPRMPTPPTTPLSRRRSATTSPRPNSTSGGWRRSSVAPASSPIARPARGSRGCSGKART